MSWLSRMKGLEQLAFYDKFRQCSRSSTNIELNIRRRACQFEEEQEVIHTSGKFTIQMQRLRTHLPQMNSISQAMRTLHDGTQ